MNKDNYIAQVLKDLSKIGRLFLEFFRSCLNFVGRIKTWQNALKFFAIMYITICNESCWMIYSIFFSIAYLCNFKLKHLFITGKIKKIKTKLMEFKDIYKIPKNWQFLALISSLWIQILYSWWNKNFPLSTCIIHNFWFVCYLEYQCYWLKKNKLNLSPKADFRSLTF